MVEKALAVRCPHCDEELTEDQVRALWGEYARSKRKTLGGPKFWKKHSKRAGSRCRCPKCDQRRQDNAETSQAAAAKPSQPGNVRSVKPPLRGRIVRSRFLDR